MRSTIPLFLAAATFLAAGAGRLVLLERHEGETLREISTRQHRARLDIPAQRGDILDTKGRVLAGSIRIPSAFVDPKLVADPRAAAYSVGPVLGLDPAELEKLITEKRESGFVWIKRGLTDEEVRAFRQIVKARRLDAFRIQSEPKRVYPNGRTAAHVLGFVGADERGMAGIEHEFGQYLRGTAGRRISTVDNHRQGLQTHAELYEPPSDGLSVILTLDTYIQQRTEEFLHRAVEECKAEWGTAVVMDVHTGEVLAMTNFPDFDPAEPIPPGASARDVERAQEHIRNRAVSDSYEPGSIFKPFIAGPAFDEGLLRLDERYVVNGPTRQFGSRTIHDTKPYSDLAFWEVMSKSSNIGMGLLGAKLGNERMHRYVRAFGFGDPTGIDLSGEHAGLVQDFSRWGPFSTQSIPIGQEIATTPIQVLTAFSVFCNDGVLMRPRIVRGVVDADGQAVYDNSRPIAVRRVLSVESARAFRFQALAPVCLGGGTGQKAALTDWQVFGKTGTAQIARLGGGGYIAGAYCGSFVCGAPLREPRVAVVVSIFRPVGAYYGGTIAAPVAGSIVHETLKYLQVSAEPLLPSVDAPPASD
jgi:cell division protein FtsI/penicillin-binding protein 2